MVEAVPGLTAWPTAVRRALQTSMPDLYVLGKPSREGRQLYSRIYIVPTKKQGMETLVQVMRKRRLRRTHNA